MKYEKRMTKLAFVCDEKPQVTDLKWLSPGDASINQSNENAVNAEMIKTLRTHWGTKMPSGEGGQRRSMYI